MRFVDRAAGAAGIPVALYLMFLPGCVCDLWIPKKGPDIEPGDASDVVAQYFVANSESGRVGAYLGLIAVFLMVAFFSRLHGALRDATPRASWLPIAVLSGGVLMAVVAIVEVGLAFAASELDNYGGETQVVRFFVLWGWNSANLLTPPFGLALVGTTLVAFSTRAFSDWCRWGSAALLVLLLLISAVLRAPGLAVAPGMLWLVLTSFMLVTHRSAVRPDP